MSGYLSDFVQFRHVYYTIRLWLRRPPWLFFSMKLIAMDIAVYKALAVSMSKWTCIHTGYNMSTE